MLAGRSQAIPAYPFGWLQRFSPGILLTLLVSLLAFGLQWLEIRLFGQPYVEHLVFAIVLGMLLRTFARLDRRLLPGIGFSSKQLLELAIVLLGASVDFPSLLSAGPTMLLAIGLVVVTSITVSSLIGRAVGLNPKLALLVACGNSICGNSAIAAVAPVIRADSRDVVSSIALTAVLGTGVVLLLPLLIPLLGLSNYQYGVLAGLSVYAVPQVLAATFPVSTLSGQIGTLVKLVRVLFLGPVVLFFALRYRHQCDASKFPLTRFVPWFIIGFIGLGTLRSLEWLGPGEAMPLEQASHWLTLIAMAALGLEVDLRALRSVGRPVAKAVLGSLLFLILLCLTVIRLFGLDGS